MPESLDNFWTRGWGRTDLDYASNYPVPFIVCLNLSLRKKTL
jgi:hypothetical protein